MTKEEYNNELVEYCGVCTSLAIVELEGSNIIYCKGCGNPNNIRKNNINVWLVENSNFKKIDRLPEISNWRYDKQGRKYHTFQFSTPEEKEQISNILKLFISNNPKYLMEEKESHFKVSIYAKH